MSTVEGIILIISCQKHKDTRLKEFKLPKDEYVGWKVIYVLGDFFLDSDYRLDGNVMTVKCEDSYIHLLKKLVLSLQYLYQIFTIKQGVLRCGDDLIFNEGKLLEFLQMESKPEFYGVSCQGRSLLNPSLNDIQSSHNDPWMVQYYKGRPQDFLNPQYNLKGVNIETYMKRPSTRNRVEGAIFYISNMSCQVLITEMQQINFNSFEYDPLTDSYPYTIEDCSVSYILYSHNIGLTHANIMSMRSHDSGNVLAIHTNKYN